MHKGFSAMLWRGLMVYLWVLLFGLMAVAALVGILYVTDGGCTVIFGSAGSCISTASGTIPLIGLGVGSVTGAVVLLYGYGWAAQRVVRRK